jgi:CMP-N-acetylneuraminic acid synthetase
MIKPQSVDTQGVLGVIHARGGSKRIPLKNIKLLAGRPLISYMVEAAMESRLLDRLIVSTDHPEIARIAREYGAEVPFMRPMDLAEDVRVGDATRRAFRRSRTLSGPDRAYDAAHHPLLLGRRHRRLHTENAR